MDAALATNIGSIIVAAIAAGAAVASQRAAAKASIRNTDTTSRTAIEAEAFERAKNFYTDTIDRQAREIAELEGDVATLKDEVKGLRNELDTAKHALRLAFPDEP